MKLIMIFLACLISHNLMATNVDKIDFEKYAKTHAYSCKPIVNPYAHQVPEENYQALESLERTIFERTELDAKIYYLNIMDTKLFIDARREADETNSKLAIPYMPPGEHEITDIVIEGIECNNIRYKSSRK